ncbi:MAG: DNA polymerase-3 subunit alpha, partial [Bacteroidia bacterium]
MQCQNAGLPVIMGVDFRTGNRQDFIAIAQNNEGFQNINYYLTGFLLQGKNTPAGVFPQGEFPQDPVIKNAFIIYPLKNVPNRPLRSNEYIGVNHTEVFRARTRLRGVFLQGSSDNDTSKYLALNTVTFRNKRDFNAHRLLRAIDKNALLSKLPKEEQGEPHHTFYSEEELSTLYDGYAFLLENAAKLLSSCSLHFDFNDKKKLANKKTFTQTQKRDYELLQQLVKEGLKYRYANGTNKEIQDRVAKELGVIQECNFVPYFLINHNIVSYARRRGYFYVGRGSGANSLIAYLLRITNVDPIELDLYFERFINPSRTSPPDFDIDFSWRDRQDVTRYIFETFPNTALMGSFVTFQARSVIREIGKVLGLPADEIKNIQRTDNP